MLKEIKKKFKEKLNVIKEISDLRVRTHPAKLQTCGKKLKKA